MTNPSTDFIPFALPSLGVEEENAALRVIRSGWLTTGKETAAFEEEFARKVGSRFALALNSATAGLHLALEALGTGPGDTVVTSPYTFTATAEAARYLGARIIFSDISPDGFNMDPLLLKKTLDECRKKNLKVKAVLPVHIAGEPCAISEILNIAADCDAAVIEDAAHAFPVRSNDGRWTGTSGKAGIYSFYATKTITTGEGGMLVTDDEKLADRVRVMRLHGIDRTIWDRYTSSAAQWSYSVVEAGYKYNMTDLAAAIGREQLKKADGFLAARRNIAQKYNRAFSGLSGVITPEEKTEHACHLYILRLTPDAPLERDTVIEKLRSQGIGTSVHYIPLHIMPYYRKLYSLAPEDFPNSLAAYQTAFSLPIFQGMTDKQVDRVIQAVKNSLT